MLSNLKPYLTHKFFNNYSLPLKVGLLSTLVALTGCGEVYFSTSYMTRTIDPNTDLNTINTGVQEFYYKESSEYGFVALDEYRDRLFIFPLIPNAQFSTAGGGIAPNTRQGDVVLHTRTSSIGTGLGALELVQDNFYVGDGPYSLARLDGEVNYDLSAGIFHASVIDEGNDSIVGWGRWINQVTLNGAVVAGCCNNENSLHYVFGTATPQAVIAAKPNTGVVTFNLIGSTTPTFNGNVLLGTSGVLTSGTVGVVWGGAVPKIGVDLVGTIGAVGYTVQSQGGATNPATSQIVYNPTSLSFSGTNTSTDNSSVSGFFAGPNADHIGLTYSAPVISGSPPINGTVSGAAAFSTP